MSEQNNKFTRVGPLKRNYHGQNNTYSNTRTERTEYVGPHTRTECAPFSPLSRTEYVGPPRPRFVVTRTGMIALYNLGPNPILLYADQWEKLESLVRKDILDKFIARNENILKRRQPNHHRTNESDESLNIHGTETTESETVEENDEVAE